MGIYYYKLWELMSRKGITQKDITAQAHISTATLTKMRNGEMVSLDVLDRIREMMDCDFGDIITSKANRYCGEIDWKNETAAHRTNGVYRLVLEKFMAKNCLPYSAVSAQTELALNTVKDFLRGKDLSSRSILKLMRLGTEYNEEVDQMLRYNEVKSNIYCKHPCGRTKPCMGLRTLWNPGTKKYDQYCLYDLKQTHDQTGELIADEECPHPKDTKEMAAAIEKYGSHLRGKVTYIPAKNEIGNEG